MSGESTAADRPRMHDMVVPLLALPDARRPVEELGRRNIVVRRAQTMEMANVCAWVNGHWPYWADGVGTAFSGSPVRVFVATQDAKLLGFAAYDIDYRGFFGPTGVDPDHQGEGIGAAVLLRCLEAMREVGYLYAVIGAVGPAEFYTRVCGAMSLPVEWPNYTDPDRS
jgi:GNAT superfamily N-acetyltransferase